MAKPKLPPYRKLDGGIGTSILEMRKTVQGVLDQPHLFGNTISVTFTAANTPTKVSTGLTGAVTGYHVTKKMVVVDVFDAVSADGTSPPGVHWLQASAATTVAIYFY